MASSAAHDHPDNDERRPAWRRILSREKPSTLEIPMSHSHPSTASHTDDLAIYPGSDGDAQSDSTVVSPPPTATTDLPSADRWTLMAEETGLPREASVDNVMKGGHVDSDHDSEVPMKSKSRKMTHGSSAPVILMLDDAHNTSGSSYYIIPNGYPVILQDEDGHELTRIGNFGKRGYDPGYDGQRQPMIVQEPNPREVHKYEDFIFCEPRAGYRHRSQRHRSDNHRYYSDRHDWSHHSSSRRQPEHHSRSHRPPSDYDDYTSDEDYGHSRGYGYGHTSRHRRHDDYYPASRYGRGDHYHPKYYTPDRSNSGRSFVDEHGARHDGHRRHRDRHHYDHARKLADPVDGHRRRE